MVRCSVIVIKQSWFLTLYGSYAAAAIDLLQSTMMHVVQVGHKSHVEFAVPRCDVMRRHKLSTVQAGRLLQHQLGPLVQIPHLHIKQTEVHDGPYNIILESNWIVAVFHVTYICSKIEHKYFTCSNYQLFLVIIKQSDSH